MSYMFLAQALHHRQSDTQIRSQEFDLNMASEDDPSIRLSVLLVASYLVIRFMMKPHHKLKAAEQVSF